MAASEANNKELRICFREPIPEIAEAAQFLDAAVSAHLGGNAAEADRLIRLADISSIRAWVESVLGKNSQYVSIRANGEPTIPLGARVPVRMPNSLEKLQLHARDGYNCRFCGIPVVRPEIRARIMRSYPGALGWGKRNIDRHAAFFAMWAQYDHLVPHARGGTNCLENIVVACAACNYGRGSHTLAEVGLINPFLRPPSRSPWDGLERFARTAI